MYDPLKSSNFISSNVCRAAFLKIQQLVTSNQVLMYYDSQKPLTLLTDASPYWLRTVLYSRILSVAEKKYSQIELLAWCVCGEGVLKFFTHFYARTFTILCQSLWPRQPDCRDRHSSCQDFIMNTTKHCNADAQSRLPVLTETQESNEETYHATLCIEQEINNLHVRCKEVQRGTVKEITLKVVVSGRPASSNNKSKNL